MPTSIVYQAANVRTGFGPWRTSASPAAAIIVVMLSLLFAAAIVSALQPAHLVDPALAAIQGGL